MLALPRGIGVASANSPFEYVPVVIAGNRTSETVGAGQRVSIMLQATWQLPGGDRYSSQPCQRTVRDVTRVEFPLAVGTLQIDLGTTWRSVCDSPASVRVRLTD